MMDAEALSRIRATAAEAVHTPIRSLTEADVLACLAVLDEAEQALEAVKRRLVEEIVSRGLPQREPTRDAEV